MKDDPTERAVVEAEALYRFCYLSSIGYIVYRHAFPDHCPLDAGAKAHKVAVFVTESEASNYCDYRNYWTRENGTDEVHKIPPAASTLTR